MKSYNEIKNLFEQANLLLLSHDQSLFANQVSERTLCGALMLHIHDIIRKEGSYNNYYTDVEYNRNKGSMKTIRKTILGPEEKVITINCDLILHSRGECVAQDNLLAIEMKKATRSKKEKTKDRDRLIALTRESFHGIGAQDENCLPEHVCRYVMGVYYEINYRSQQILIEYYHRGAKDYSYIISYKS